MSESGSIHPDILEQAADWLVLIHSGQMTKQQEQEYLAWKTAHPNHQKAIDRVEKFTSGLSQLPENLDQNVFLHSSHQLTEKITKKLLIIFAPIIAFATAYQYLPWQQWQADVSSKTGEVKTLHLQDGSTLTLASNSYINIHFDDKKREIELVEGEIYIQTAKESNIAYRPFIVSTINGAVKALGTQFTVHQGKKQQDTHVEVYQHAVAIRPEQNQSRQTVIQQGEQTQFDSHVVHHPQTNTLPKPYWTQHLLVVENKSLDQVLSEIYRYQNGKYFISDTAKHIQVSGVYSLKNPKQNIEALAKTYDLELSYYSDYILYVRK